MALKTLEIDGITLPTRCWRTYDLIKTNTLKGRTTSQIEIVNNYPFKVCGEIAHTDGYEWNSNPKTHDHCSAVWKDINQINMANGIHKVIISPTPFTYKIAETPEEIKQYIEETYKKPAIAKLVRYSNMKRKLERDGQVKLIFDSKSSARDYWQTFVDNIVDDLVKVSESDNDETNDPSNS